jgi:hypothetical protein
MNSDLLSAKALGILFYITSTDARISAENLSTVFGEGEKAIGSGLRELRDRKLTVLKHEKVNGQLIKYTFVTELGWETIANFMRMPSPNSPYTFSNSSNHQNGGIDTSNEQLSKLILNIYKYKPNTFREEKSVTTSELNTRESHNVSCPNCIRAITPLGQRLETERGKQAAYDAKKLNKHRIAIDKRQGRAKETWSISDVCMEIAERAANIWGLPPWRLSESRLVAAFTQLRRKWGTDGEIEMHAFDFFMRRINTKEYPSVDALWQSFIYQFPEILPKVKAMFPSEEQVAERKRVGEINRKKLNELLLDSNQGPTPEEAKRLNSEIVRLKRLVHHFTVMTEESSRTGEAKSSQRYQKALHRINLDLAIIRQDSDLIDQLKTQIDALAEVEDFPEGQYII